MYRQKVYYLPSHCVTFSLAPAAPSLNRFPRAPPFFLVVCCVPREGSAMCANFSESPIAINFLTARIHPHAGALWPPPMPTRPTPLPCSSTSAHTDILWPAPLSAHSCRSNIPPCPIPTTCSLPALATCGRLLQHHSFAGSWYFSFSGKFSWLTCACLLRRHSVAGFWYFSHAAALCMESVVARVIKPE
jgi:hypothetical protein